MLKLFLLFCFSPFAVSPLVADETHVIDDVWFELADCYQGEAVFALEGSDRDVDWKRVEFFLCTEAMAMRSYRIETDGGETLYDQRHATAAESIAIYHEHSSVSLSSRFRETLTDAGERELGPMQIQRLIDQRRDELGLHIVERHDDATVTVGFTLTTNGQTEQHEFDVLDRRITAHRSIQRNGRFVVEVRYGGWRELDNGQPIPASMHSRNGFGVDEIRTNIRVVSASSVARAPKRPVIPTSYTIRQTADQQGESTPPVPPRDEQRSVPGSGNSPQRVAAPILILAGGVLILFTGVIMVARFRRG